MPRLALLLILLTGCAGDTPATVKGRLTHNGESFALPANAGEVFLVFKWVNDDDTVDPVKFYTALVRPDGTFEVVASGGELPVGKYQVAIDSAPGKVPLFAPFALSVSKVRVEFRPGANDVAIDLAKTN